MYDQLIDAVNEISYLRITLESTGGWNRHRMKQMVKRNQSLVVINKCLTRTPDKDTAFRKCI
jgi:3-keto-L-gulonate-6-phosphate decarboxylase